MKKHTFKPEQYSPSSEEHRKCIELQRNYHRNNAYYNKHEINVCEPWYAHIDGDTEYQAQFEEQSE